MEKIRNKVWYDVLDADLSRRYFDHLAASYYRYDLYSKIFVAIMSSGVVAGWVLWTDTAKYPYGVLAWKILSAVSAILSIILPIINFAKKFEASSRLKGGWNDILREYEILWIGVDENSQQFNMEEITRIGQKETALENLESILPTHKRKLIKQCQEEVIQARGMQQ